LQTSATKVIAVADDQAAIRGLIVSNRTLRPVAIPASMTKDAKRR
jgi:hypothetical protein